MVDHYADAAVAPLLPVTQDVGRVVAAPARG
jgi:hypothetical protein